MGKVMKILFSPFIGLWKLNMLLGRMCANITTGIIGRGVHFCIMSMISGFIMPGLMYVIVWLYVKSQGITNEQMEAMGTDIVKPVGGVLIGILVAFTVFSMLSPFLANRAYREKKESKGGTFGNARYSRAQELKDFGLQSQKGGVVLGKMNNKIVEKSPQLDGHITIFGGSGDGKSTAVGIPTLIRWKGGALVVDIKGDLQKKTAHIRENLGPVFIFNPDDPDGHRYDPIQDAKDFAGAQQLGRALILEESKENAFFSDSARAIVSAMAYDYAQRGGKFQEMCEELLTADLQEIVERLHSSHYREVRILIAPAVDLLKNERAWGSVATGMKRLLITLAGDLNIGRATSGSDFSAYDFMEGATIYLTIREEMIEQYADLFRLIMTQITRKLTTRPDHAEPALLFMIDELPRFGRVDGLISSLATLRSRNVHYVLMSQSVSQFDLNYSETERKIMFDTCRYIGVMSTMEPTTQEYFSKLSGQKTATTQSASAGTSFSISMSQTGVPLIRPEEFGLLDRELILFARRLQPSRLKLSFWYEDKAMTQLVKAGLREGA